MLAILILLFTVVPLIEIYFLIQAADILGGGNTFLFVILTGIIGAYLAKSQGRTLLLTIQSKLSQNLLPTDEMIQGFMVLVGGILLVTPGFLTDILGFTLVLPFTRWLFVAIVKRALLQKMKSGQFKVYTQHANYSTNRDQRPSESNIRDVTPKKIDE